MNIQINNSFELRLQVLAQGAREPMTSASDVRVVFQCLDNAAVRWEAHCLTITDDCVVVQVSPDEARSLGRYLVGVYYNIAGAQRYAENGAAFSLVRTAAEADAEGESVTADLAVKFAASGKNGLSAYEIAQQNGYAGTFEEWVAAGENANNAAAAAVEAATAAAKAGANAQAAAAQAAVDVAKAVADADAAVDKAVDRAGTAEQAANEAAGRANEAADTAETLALRKLFVTAGAEYNNTNVNKAKTAPWGETVQHLPKHYYLNGLGDITEDEMTEIYNAGRVMQDVAGIYNSNNKIRTNLPALHATDAGYSRSIDGRGMFLACTKLEVAILSKNIESTNKIIVDGSSAQNVFFNCPKVRYISRLSIDGGTSTNKMFELCRSLSHVEIKHLSTNLSFSDSPLIDKESILYLIQNSKAKSAITITLHHDTYVKLTADQEVLDTLTAKNEALAAQGGKLSLVCATHKDEVTPNA